MARRGSLPISSNPTYGSCSSSDRWWPWPEESWVWQRQLHIERTSRGRSESASPAGGDERFRYALAVASVGAVESLRVSAAGRRDRVQDRPHRPERRREKRRLVRV